MADKTSRGKTHRSGAASEAKTAPRRSGKPFHRPTKAVESRLKSAAARKGFAEPDVLRHWAEAVGTHLSTLCAPVKVSYAGAIGATLTVRVEPGRAPEVKHEEPRILERINAFYGYRAISRLKLTQATGFRGQPGFAESAAAFHGQPGMGAGRSSRLGPRLAAPDQQAVDKAADLTREIRHTGLRDALTRMGAWVLANPKSPTAAQDGGAQNAKETSS